MVPLMHGALFMLCVQSGLQKQNGVGVEAALADRQG